MSRKTLLTLLSFVLVFLTFNLSMVNAQSNINVKIFHIEKNEIIKTIPTNSKVQVEVTKIIKEIDGVVKHFKPIPDKGYMIKIPIEPPQQVKNKWINDLIDEVTIIIPEEEEPYLLIFDDENKSYFLTFQTKIDTLLNNLNFSL